VEKAVFFFFFFLFTVWGLGMVTGIFLLLYLFLLAAFDQVWGAESRASRKRSTAHRNVTELHKNSRHLAAEDNLSQWVSSLMMVRPKSRE
jgi:hypothetical protein